jgi:CMP-N-acetylneuraminic acid synthetase
MTDAPSRICFIPARGGSKRLPRKNVLPFMGKPMLAWSIDCAKDTGLFGEIIVSSEEVAIGELAQAYGATWQPRRTDLAGDRVSVTDVCLDFLNHRHVAGTAGDVLTVLYATAPLRAKEDIVATVATVESGRADFAMTVTGLPYDPSEALVVAADGAAQVWQPELLAASRHDRPNFKIDAGSVYVVRVASFLEQKNFYGTPLKVVEIPRERAVDIDTAEDFARAEFYATRQQGAA